MKSKAFGFIALLVLAFNGWAGPPVSSLPLIASPARPALNQAFSVTYQLETCGQVFPIGTPPVIEVDGNIIRVIALLELNACIPGQPYVSSYTWQVGPLLRAGSFELELYGYLAGAPANRILLATGDVAVAGVVASAPNVVPALDHWSLVLLLAFVALVSFGALRFSRS